MRILCLFVASCFLLSCEGQMPKSSTVDDDIVHEFRCYRNSLHGQQDSEILGFFSRSFLESRLDSILLSGNTVIEHNVSVARKDIRVGERVNYVHGYEVTKTEKDRYSLTIMYSRELRDAVSRLDLVYEAKDDGYLIDGLSLYFYDFPKDDDFILEDFVEDASHNCNRVGARAGNGKLDRREARLE